MASLASTIGGFIANAEKFGNYWKDLLVTTWHSDWMPGAGLEANLAGLPILAAPTRLVPMARTAGEGVDIALGLSNTATHAPGLLQRFAAKVGAAGWWKWESLGLAEFGGPFSQTFLAAANNARSIRFNLSGMNLAGATRVGMEGFEVPGLVTTAELMTIVRNPALLAKTSFYRDGRLLTTAEVLKELGL